MNNNLSNLRWDTVENNCLDRFKHGTISYGENQGSSKLKECEVNLIKHLLNNKIKHSKIAKMFKISRKNIYDICCDKIWKHVKISM